MDKNPLDLEREIHQLKGGMLDNGVGLILLDLQLAIRRAYPDPVDVDPYERKIVAYLREHLVS